jgi:hypothetical protein
LAFVAASSRLGLEDLDELAADDLALGLGVAHARQVAQELLAGVDVDHLGVQAADEHVHHHVAFVQAQQAVVDEHAGQLVADGAVDQRRGHAGVDAADRPRMTSSSAHLSRMRATASSTWSRITQSGRRRRCQHEALEQRRPCTVCVTSGWNCTP